MPPKKATKDTKKDTKSDAKDGAKGGKDEKKGGTSVKVCLVFRLSFTNYRQIV